MIKPRLRKLFGMIILVIFVIIYAFFAMIIGAAMTEKNLIVQIIYFSFAGLIWVLPAGLIIKWMAKTDFAA